MHTIVCRANMRGTRSVISTLDEKMKTTATLLILSGILVTLVAGISWLNGEAKAISVMCTLSELRDNSPDTFQTLENKVRSGLKDMNQSFMILTWVGGLTMLSGCVAFVATLLTNRKGPSNTILEPSPKG